MSEAGDPRPPARWPGSTVVSFGKRKSLAARDQWSDKEKEGAAYAIPNGALWRVFERIENPGARLTLREQFEDTKSSLTFEVVLAAYKCKLRRGSHYLTLRCPNPHHEDHDPSCVVWPAIAAFRCYGCGSSGDIIEFIRLIEEQK